MKYIDAQKLKEEIQANLAAISFNDDYQEGYEACGMSVLKSIDSLQQEQQEEDFEKEIEEYWIATGWSKHITLGKFKVIARYFYGLGQLNAK